MMESEGKMTTTDARGWINALIKAMHEETSGSWPDPEYKDEVYSALEMAIKALENHDTFMKYAYSQGKQDALSQEPCDYTGNEFFNFDAPMVKKSMEQDAVSRAKIIDELNRLGRNAFKDDTDYDNFFAFVDSLSSVTQKLGKWLVTHLSNMAYCSECDYLFKDIPASIVEHFNYCPNCGARMESEE